MLYFILLYIIVTYSWKSNEEAYTFHALAAFKPSTHYPLDFIKAIAPLIVKPNFGPTLINPAWENPAHYHGTKDYLAYNPAAGQEKAVMCYSFGLVNTCNIIDSFTIPSGQFGKGINIFPFAIEMERTCSFLAEVFGFTKDNQLSVSTFQSALSIKSRVKNKESRKYIYFNIYSICC